MWDEDTVSSRWRRAIGISLAGFGLLVPATARAFDTESTLGVPPGTKDAVATSSAAMSAEGQVAVGFASATVFDTQAPDPGAASAPEYLKAGPVTVSVSNAIDAGGSGLKTARLWTKQGDTGNWTQTALSYDFQEGETGTTFNYPDLLGEGSYFFAVVMEDNAGNISPDPSGEGAAKTILDNTKPVLTLVGSSALAWDMGTPYTDPGATASDALEGNITSRIQVTNNVNVNAPGSYTVAYNVSDLAGNAATSISRTVTIVEPTGTYALTISQPSTGSISANPAPNAENGRYLPGTEVTLAFAGTQLYDVASWSGATVQPGSVNLARTVMNGNKTVGVTLQRATGTVAVDVTPNSATWKITDGDGELVNGSGDSSVQVATGNVSIAFNPITGMKTPANKSGTLSKGQTLSFAGAYEESAFNLSAPANLSGGPGATVNCPITISNTNGLQAYSFSLTFDGNLLEATNATAGTATGPWGAVSWTPSNGSVQVSASGTALSGGSGQLAVISLKVKETVDESATADLVFGLTSLTANGAAVTDVSTTPGTFAIEIGEFIWGDANGDNLANATDANLMLQLAAGSINTLPVYGNDGSTAGADVSGNEPAFVGAYDAALVLQKGEGIISTFPADNNGDGSGPDLTSKESSLADTLIKSIDSSVTRTVRLAGSTSVEPGAMIDVPIGIDMSDRILGFQFVLEYDSGLLTLDNVSKGGLISEWLSPVINNVPGSLGIAAAGTSAPAGTGSLAIVRFRVNSNAAPGEITNFSLSNLYLNDGTVPSTVSTATLAPELNKVSPNRGADSGGTVVELTGVNLGAVDSVFFGDIPADTFEYNPTKGALLVVAPPGSGSKIDVTVSSLGQASTKERAFTYYTASVKVNLADGKAADTGLAFELPVLFETDGRKQLNSLTFVLNYDPKMFAALDPTKALGVVSAAPAAQGLQVSAALRRAGQLEINMTGKFLPGELCTVRLVPIGTSAQTRTLLFVNAIEAFDGNSKAVEAAGGMSISTGAQ